MLEYLEWPPRLASVCDLHQRASRAICFSEATSRAMSCGLQLLLSAETSHRQGQVVSTERTEPQAGSTQQARLSIGSQEKVYKPIK